MAYFGRKPKKPGSVPGAASGFAQKERIERAELSVERRVSQSRPERAARPGKALRAVRAARTGRSSR